MPRGSPFRRSGGRKVTENQEQGEERSSHGMAEYTDAPAAAGRNGTNTLQDGTNGEDGA